MCATRIPSRSQSRHPDPAVLAALRARLAVLGGTGPQPAGVSVATLGVAAVDQALPWAGLPRACLHELVAADASGAASGFAAVLLARLAGEQGSVVWCRRERGLYGPGLAAFGLDADRLIVVHARTDADLLWAMEEGLRSGAVAAVLGESRKTGRIALRRLQLAAELAGVTALLLRPAGDGMSPASSAVTRWRIVAAASHAEPPAEGIAAPGVGPPCWQVELVRCRVGMPGMDHVERAAAGSGAPRSWLLEWRDEARGLVVAAPSGDRPARPTAPRHDVRLAG